MEKCFIISELDFEELEVDFTERIEEFIEEKLGMIASRQTEVSVEYQEYIDEGMKCFKDEFRCELWIEVKFNQYTYKNEKMNEKRIESYNMQFEYKGRKPFYIDGKFVTMNVFEWVSCCPIQQTKILYGVKKDELGDMIDNLVMIC